MGSDSFYCQGKAAIRSSSSRFTVRATGTIKVGEEREAAAGLRTSVTIHLPSVLVRGCGAQATELPGHQKYVAADHDNEKRINAWQLNFYPTMSFDAEPRD